MPTETDDGGFFNLITPSELPNIPRKGNNYYMEFVWPSINLTNATYNTSQAYGVVISRTNAPAHPDWAVKSGLRAIITARMACNLMRKM